CGRACECAGSTQVIRRHPALEPVARRLYLIARASRTAWTPGQDLHLGAVRQAACVRGAERVGQRDAPIVARAAHEDPPADGEDGGRCARGTRGGKPRGLKRHRLRYSPKEVKSVKRRAECSGVAAARRAFDEGRWPHVPPPERERFLLKVADLIETHADELAQLETLDNGKPFMESRHVDIPAAAATFRYYAGWVSKIYGETNPSDEAFFNFTLREPVGVCGQIIPWNFPLLMAAWKLGPALACGNTSVLKPAEQTPLTALRLGELLLEAGLPDGVVNIVPGFGETAGRAIVRHPMVAKIAAGMKQGNPFDADTRIGPLVSQEQLERVTGYLEIGKKEGAKPLIGGERNMAKGLEKGYYVKPTVFTGVRNDMKIAREEIFGPVVSVIPFKDEHDAVLQGNDTTYGLAAGIWTRDVSKAHRVARALRARDCIRARGPRAREIDRSGLRRTTGDAPAHRRLPLPPRLPGSGRASGRARARRAASAPRPPHPRRARGRHEPGQRRGRLAERDGVRRRRCAPWSGLRRSALPACAASL